MGYLLKKNPYTLPFQSLHQAAHTVLPEMKYKTSGIYRPKQGECHCSSDGPHVLCFLLLLSYKKNIFIPTLKLSTVLPQQSLSWWDLSHDAHSSSLFKQYSEGTHWDNIAGAIRQTIFHKAILILKMELQTRKTTGPSMQWHFLLSNELKSAIRAIIASFCIGSEN